MTTVDPTAPDLPKYGVGLWEAYVRFWRRYLVFSGRASLSEYWWVQLAHAVVFTALGILIGILAGISAALQSTSIYGLPAGIAGIFALLLLAYAVAIIVPSIAISVRRLHDADMSGLFLLLVLIPSVGSLILLVLHVLPSNAEGRRFDVGGRGWAGAPYPGAPAAVPYPGMPAPALARDAAWPAPAAPSATAPAAPAPPAPLAPLTPVVGDASLPPARPPMTTPVPLAEQPDEPVAGIWDGVGAVDVVEPPFTAQPSWRRQRFVRVLTPGLALLGTDGLSTSEGAAALGSGAEVWLASPALAALTPAELSSSWQLAVVAGVARRITATGVNLPAELEQYRSLSMSLPVPGAPSGWSGPGDAIGVLLGIGRPEIQDTVVTPRGEVRLVGVVPLRPEELQRIIEGGRPARDGITDRLAALPPDQLLDPNRPAV